MKHQIYRILLYDCAYLKEKKKKERKNSTLVLCYGKKKRIVGSKMKFHHPCYLESREGYLLFVYCVQYWEEGRRGIWIVVAHWEHFG